MSSFGEGGVCRTVPVGSRVKGNALCMCGAALSLLLLGGAAFSRESREPPIVENACVPKLKLATGWCGDGGPARLALASNPSSLTVTAEGGFAFSDTDVAAIRLVRPTGSIERVAGTGTPGYGGDGGRADKARISREARVAALPDGGLLIADAANHRVRRISRGGVISTVAGTGEVGLSGDGGQATRARLSRPMSVAALPDGGFLIADTGNRRIRRVGTSGVISSVAGTGRRGTDGDGGPATAAQFVSPDLVVSLPDGRFLIGDDLVGNDVSPTSPAVARLRLVSASGVIRTVFTSRDWGIRGVAPVADGFLVAQHGGGLVHVSSDWKSVVRLPGKHCPPNMWTPIAPGDGGPLARAYFAPSDVAATSGGAVLIADALFGRIRRISPTGIITTVAGGGGRQGRLLVDSPCGGASPEYQPWNYFGIVSARGLHDSVSVQFGTTLAARVTIVVRQGSRTLARRTLRAKADLHTVRIGGLPVGRSRVQIFGRHEQLRRTDERTVRVR